jgi:hypothetical protein
MSRFLLLFLGLYMFGCKQKTIPENVLPPDKMQAVLWDVLQADEMINYYSPADSTYKSLEKHIELFQTIFQVHHITKEAFKKSLGFYESRPDMLKTILDSMQKRSVAPVSLPKEKTAVDSSIQKKLKGVL